MNVASRPLAISIVVCLVLTIVPSTVEANHARLMMPFQPGSTWGIIRGYNIATHPPQTYQMYSFDLIRDDGQTSEQTIVAGAAGTVAWKDSTNGCVTINLQDNYYLMTCHILDVSSFSTGQLINQGQSLGTVAPAGQSGNNGVPHIHITLYSATTPNADPAHRTAIPFDSDHGTKLDGYDFPSDGTANQYGGMTGLRSTNGTVDRTMSGVFYNLEARSGGTVDVNLTLQPTTATGHINFTQLPEDAWRWKSEQILSSVT